MENNSRNDILNKIFQDSIPGAKKNPDEVRICCHFCEKEGKSPDVNYSLYIDFKKYGGIYHCFRCDTSGTLGKDFSLLVSAGDTTLNLDDIRAKVLKAASRQSIIDDSYFNLDEISYPLSKSGTPIAFDYMIKRGFSEEEIEKYSLRVGKSYMTKDENNNDYEERKWKGRVLFPFIENGQVVYIVGRSYVGAIPKYRNSEGTKANIVYGLDYIKDEIAILTEGIVSGIAATRSTGIPFLSCLGKTLSDIQVSKIRSKIRKLYLSYDGSGVTTKELNKAIRILSKQGFEIWNVTLPLGKDPDDLKEEYIKYFKEAKLSNGFGFM